MDDAMTRSYTAFEGTERIARGELSEVAFQARIVLDRGGRAPVLVFDDESSEQVEVDWRGSPEEVAQRVRDAPKQESATARGRGRPKLGVVAREVTLLPRHWEWLGSQPGGCSVALRKLVEEARHARSATDRTRRARESSYRFMSTVAGNLPDFEEATRALFAGDRARFQSRIAGWPEGVREQLARLTIDAFGSGAPALH